MSLVRRLVCLPRVESSCAALRISACVSIGATKVSSSVMLVRVFDSSSMMFILFPLFGLLYL